MNRTRQASNELFRGNKNNCFEFFRVRIVVEESLFEINFFYCTNKCNNKSTLIHGYIS